MPIGPKGREEARKKAPRRMGQRGQVGAPSLRIRRARQSNTPDCSGQTKRPSSRPDGRSLTVTECDTKKPRATGEVRCGAILARPGVG
jgi:hypothetical protein